MYKEVFCILASSIMLVHSSHRLTYDSPRKQNIYDSSPYPMSLPQTQSVKELTDYLDTEFRICDFSQKHLNVDKLRMVVYDFADGGRRVMLPLRHAASYIHTNLDLSRRQWIVYIPGFNTPVSVRDGGSAEMLRAMSRLKSAYYLVVDHTEYTSVDYWGYVLCYLSAVRHTYSIAGAVAAFLGELTRRVAPARVRLVGHSLGGQVAGQAGFIYRRSEGKLLARISALDPAGPCFRSMGPTAEHAHVRSGAAARVEVFHCNAGVLGSSGAVADADYFYNDRGVFQPRCDQPSATDRCRCSHAMCPPIYAASARNATWYPAVEANDDGATVVSGFVGSDDEGVFTVMTDKYPIEP